MEPVSWCWPSPANAMDRVSPLACSPVQVDGRVLHGDLGADVAIDPLHGGALFADGALGHQVVHVVGPVLDGGVADAGALLDDDFHDGGVQRVRGVDRRGAALDVVDVGVLVRDDQRALELAHVFRVDAEVGLQRNVHVDALGDVHEGSAGPHGRVQRGKLVVAHGNDGAEVLLEDLRVLAQRRVGVQEDDALGLEVLADLVVDHLGLVLGCHTGDQAAALGFRDAQLLVRVPDVLGKVFPGGGLLLRGAHEVLDVVEVDAGKVRAPGGHGLAVEVLQALEAQVQHPLRLALLGRDVADDFLVEAAAWRWRRRRSCRPSRTRRYRFRGARDSFPESPKSQQSQQPSSLIVGPSSRPFLQMVGYFVQVVRNGSGGFRHRCGRTACWYVGGADVAPARQGGEPPHVDADQPGKDLGFSIAENRELRCELLDGAVTLAQLDAGKRCRQRRLGFDGRGGGYVAVRGTGRRKAPSRGQ